MPGLLNIPDDLFKSTAAQISGNTDTTPLHVEQILRSYVYLGVNKKIADYSTLNSTDKQALSQAVQRQARYIYSYEPPLWSVQDTLNELTLEAMNGQADQRIAYPRTWQLRQEQAAAQSAADTALKHPLGPFDQLISDFFGGMKTTVQTALKSAGVDIPVETILVIVMVLVVFAVLSSFRRA
jgi:hypothetical protein